MFKYFTSCAVAVGTIAALAATPAEARFHGHVLGVQGPNGGFRQYRAVSRTPGHVGVARGVQTDSGRGYRETRTHDVSKGQFNGETNVQTNGGRGLDTQRNATWGNGSYSGGKTTTTDAGKTYGHSTTANRNSDGSVGYDTNYTRRDGTTGERSGTIDRPL